MTYWLNSGFSVDPNNGVQAMLPLRQKSFRMTRVYLRQFSTTEETTLSAQIASKSLEKFNGQVGIEVL